MCDEIRFDCTHPNLRETANTFGTFTVGRGYDPHGSIWNCPDCGENMPRFSDDESVFEFLKTDLAIALIESGYKIQWIGKSNRH